MPHVHCPSLTSLCFVSLSAVSSGCFVINLNISCLRKSDYLTTKNMQPIINWKQIMIFTITIIIITIEIAMIT